MSYTLFISDLHLDPQQPHITTAFFDLLKGPAKQADALYILGDLFEVWIGDDDTCPFHRKVIEAMRKFSNTDIPCYFMRGNRDVLIGKRFARETGFTLLNDPTVINLYNNPTLLMHGDTLCTDDEEYQQYRRKATHPLFKWAAYRIPLLFRKKLAKKMRAKSKQHNQATYAAKLDAVQSTIESDMMKFNVQRLIHGHTHRPGIHSFSLGEQPAERIVLGSWHHTSSVLSIYDNHKIALQSKALLIEHRS